jgi:hypothetical protein
MLVAALYLRPFRTLSRRLALVLFTNILVLGGVCSADSTGFIQTEVRRKHWGHLERHPLTPSSRSAT